MIGGPGDELKEILKFYQEIGASFLTVRKENPQHSLTQLHNDISGCEKCNLHLSKTHYVPGEGSLSPDVFFIGEGPGETEDRFGRPFIGKAGQLLDKIILKMGYSREQVFIGNIVKCRPPQNRNPLPDEVAACLPYLHRQIDILKPRVLVCLGKVALESLLGREYSISRARGDIFEFRGIPVVPTFHPSYILHQRTKEAVSRAKWDVWKDMEEVLKILDAGG
jgi:DNA polymerase